MLRPSLRALAAYGALLMIAGCAKTYDSKGVFDGTQLYHDKYKAQTVVEGVSLGGATPTGSEHRLISTSLDANGEILAQWVGFRASGSDMPLLFATAHDASARPLRVETLERKRQTHDDYASEEVAVYLPPGYLAQHRHDQIDIEIEGRHGNRVANFGPVYLEGYMAKLLTAQACIKAKTC